MSMTALAYASPTLSGEQRRSERMQITVPALIYAGGMPHSAQLQNISAGGALLTTRAALAVGDSIELSCGTIRATAIVKRKVAELMAVEFAVPLPERQLNEQTSRANAIASRRSLQSVGQ